VRGARKKAFVCKVRKLGGRNKIERSKATNGSREQQAPGDQDGRYRGSSGAAGWSAGAFYFLNGSEKGVG